MKGNAWSSQAADAFLRVGGTSLGGWAFLYWYFSASATSLKKNQLINVKLVPETVINRGCKNNAEGESPRLCLWRQLLHYLAAIPLIPHSPPVSVPLVPSPSHDSQAMLCGSAWCAGLCPRFTAQGQGVIWTEMQQTHEEESELAAFLGLRALLPLLL